MLKVLKKATDDVNFDKLVSVNPNLIDANKPSAPFLSLHSAHRDCTLLNALSDAFPAVFVEDAEDIYWDVGGEFRSPSTMPEAVLRWYILRALQHETDADPNEYIGDYMMFSSTKSLCEKLIEEFEYNHEYEDSVICDPETGEYLFDYNEPGFEF